MTYTCKYCGHECMIFNLSEKAHVCYRCGILKEIGIELETDLFWNKEADEKYFKEIKNG